MGKDVVQTDKLLQELNSWLFSCGIIKPLTGLVITKDFLLALIFLPKMQ